MEQQYSATGTWPNKTKPSSPDFINSSGCSPRQHAAISYPQPRQAPRSRRPVCPGRSGSSRPSGPALGRDDEFGGGGDCFHVGVGLFDLVEVVAAVDRHSGGPSARRGGTLGRPLLAGSVGAGSFTLLLVVISSTTPLAGSLSCARRRSLVVRGKSFWSLGKKVAECGLCTVPVGVDSDDNQFGANDLECHL